MRYYLVLACGHGASIQRKVFQPHVGDQFKCYLCRDHPLRRVTAVSSKQETEDGKTYNG